MSELSSLPITPGALVAGKYRTERLLGQGGMGAVVLAKDETTGQPLAIKFLLPSLRDEGHFVQRFRREAQATARLSSEHVPRVLDVGTTPEGAPFIVMEYCEGRDLRLLVKEDGPLTEQQAASYVGQACVALAEAHALGIIHRDLKPSNLLLGQSADGKPLIKVLDFGVAKVRPTPEDRGHDITATGTILGSRLFMAPEQMRRPRDVDARADIWALGVCLYYLVTGHTPFEATSTEEVILAVVMHPPKPLRDHAPRCSAAFEAVVLRCLEKSPRERFESVTELVRALAPLSRSPAATASAPGASAPKPSPPILAVPPDDGATEPSLSAAPTQIIDARLRTAIMEAHARRTPERPQHRGRRSGALIAAVSLALGVLVGLAALALGGRSGPDASDALSEALGPVASALPPPSAVPPTATPEVPTREVAPVPAHAASAASDAPAKPARPAAAAPSGRAPLAPSARPPPSPPDPDSPW